MENQEQVSIIVPIYNEQENIISLHQRITAVLEKSGLEAEIVYVDDGSTDESLACLQEVLSSDSHTSVVELIRNYGQTAAISAGIANSTGEVIVLLDGDLQNDPADIPRLLAKLDEGYDLVSGWRVKRQDARLTRKLPSWLANRLISKATGVKLHDYGCTLKAYRRDMLEQFQLYGEMHRLIPAYMALQGAKITELPVAHHPRRAGISKYGLSRTLRVLLDLLVFLYRAHFATKPVYAYGYVAALWLLIGCLTLSCALLRPLRGERLPFVQGSEAACTLISFVCATLCILLGLQAEQAMRTYYEVQNSTPYSVRVVHSNFLNPLVM